MRTRFPQYVAALDRAGIATSNHGQREIIRDLPYFRMASRSLLIAAGDDATMREYDMPFEEQVKLLVKEFKGLKGSMDERFDSIDTKLESLDGRVQTIDGRLESLDGKVVTIDGRLESVDGKVQTIDGRLGSLDGKVLTIDGRLESVDGKVQTIDGRLGSLDGKVQTLDGRVQTLDGSVQTLGGNVQTLGKNVHTIGGKIDKMQVLLEETHAIAKLGLEGLQGLRESTDEKFAAAAKANAEQTDMLKSLVVHVRKRVERIEPKRRRRRT